MRALLRWAPWVLLGVYGALVAVAGTMALRGTTVSEPGLLVVMTAFAVVGTVLAARLPRNTIGWLCLGMSLAGASQSAARAYATHGLIADPGSLPGAQFAAWWVALMSTVGIVSLLMLLPLLFPTGRPPSPRWRPVLWLVLGLIVVGTLGSAFTPGPIGAAPEFVNPVGLEILGKVPTPVAAVVGTVFILTFMAASLLSVASLVARYRHAGGPERQQLKWFFYTFLLAFGVFFVGSTAAGILSGGDPAATVKSPQYTAWWSPLYTAWWSVLFPATILTVPIAIGIAVLRYRLYDIDLIINRTLVYGALTAILAAAYVGAIALLQVVLQPFTQGSQLAVAASTLAVAALFQPLRAQIQRAVDRRFYRSRYDAERTVDRFAGRLRDALDLAALSGELIGVVGETMRPARAGLWLRQRS